MALPIAEPTLLGFAPDPACVNLVGAGLRRGAPLAPSLHVGAQPPAAPSLAGAWGGQS